VIAGGATHNSIHAAIQSTEPPKFECTLLVFFYSGHGEQHGSPSATEAYFLLKKPPSGTAVKPAARVDRGELGAWLAEFQRKNPLARSTGGPQSAFEPAPVLVILQACDAGAWIDGSGGLDQQIINANGGEVLMSSKRSECSFGPAGAGAHNSFFVENLLAGMGVAGGPVSGFSIFEAAGKKTTDEARKMCSSAGGCPQHPIDWSNPPMTTIYLHQ
jgi:hypothetical protein